MRCDENLLKKAGGRGQKAEGTIGRGFRPRTPVPFYRLRTKQSRFILHSDLLKHFEYVYLLVSELIYVIACTTS
jgi:hypothetical protein